MLKLQQSINKACDNFEYLINVLFISGSRKLQLAPGVSHWKYSHSKKSIPLLPDQTLITGYFDKITNDRRRIEELITVNKELRAILSKHQDAQLLQPNFMQRLVQHVEQNRTKGRNSYDEDMKAIALYLFVLSGPHAYDILHRNLTDAMPSLSSCRKYLAALERTDEGEIRFNRISEYIKKNDELPFVVIGEDDTKLSERPRYDAKNDEIVGLQLPLDRNGLPIRGSFKFTTLKEVQSYLRDNKTSSYAKLLTVRSITPGSKVYHLLVYGTRGADKGSDVGARWSFIFKEFAKIGIAVVGELLFNNFVNYFCN